MDVITYKKPWVVARVYNESENIIFMSGHDQDQILHADILSPNGQVAFWVRDEEPVKISARGFCCIYLNFCYDKEGYPQNTQLVFEKFGVAPISNKLGPYLSFRKQIPVAPFAEQVNFRILLDQTVIMATDKRHIQNEMPLNSPIDVIRPPFCT